MFKFRGIEFRTGGGSKGAQSVFPPSDYHRGGQYPWLPGLTLDDCDPTDIPPCVLGILHAAEVEGDPNLATEGRQAREADHWKRIAGGVREGDSAGGRNASAASLIGKLLRGQGDISSPDAVRPLWLLVQAWNEQNRPPLPPDELKTTWLSILNAERLRRADANDPPFDNATGTDAQLDYLRAKLGVPTLAGVNRIGTRSARYELVTQDGSKAPLGGIADVRQLSKVRAAIIDHLAMPGPSDSRGWPQAMLAIRQVARQVETGDRDGAAEWLDQFEQKHGFDPGHDIWEGKEHAPGSREWWNRAIVRVHLDDFESNRHREACFRDRASGLWFKFEVFLWFVNYVCRANLQDSDLRGELLAVGCIAPIKEKRRRATYKPDRSLDEVREARPSLWCWPGGGCDRPPTVPSRSIKGPEEAPF